MLKRPIRTFAARALMAAVLSLSSAFVAFAADKDIIILNTNDVHCGVEDNIGYAGLALYEKEMKEQAGEDPLRREGYRDGTWVLLDYGCVVVHVFSAEAREFYSLERLWHDGKPLDLSGVLTAD